MREAKLAIREVVENWALWRDAGDWKRFATVRHDDGVMSATWFQGSARAFIDAGRLGSENGVNILHFLGGFTVGVRDKRAVTQTKMTILQCAPVDAVKIDVSCIGRFYDFFEKRDGQRKIVRRQPVHEKDHIKVAGGEAELRLDPLLLSRCPVGYRHLGYVAGQERVPGEGGAPRADWRSSRAALRAGRCLDRRGRDAVKAAWTRAHGDCDRLTEACNTKRK